MLQLMVRFLYMEAWIDTGWTYVYIGGYLAPRTLFQTVGPFETLVSFDFDKYVKTFTTAIKVNKSAFIDDIFILDL